MHVEKKQNIILAIADVSILAILFTALHFGAIDRLACFLIAYPLVLFLGWLVSWSDPNSTRGRSPYY